MSGSRNPTKYRLRNLAASNKALDQIADLLGFKLDRKAVMVANVRDMSDQQLDDAEAAALEEAKRAAWTSAAPRDARRSVDMVAMQVTCQTTKCSPWGNVALFA